MSGSRHSSIWLASLALLMVAAGAIADTPRFMSYQGRVVVLGTNFNGVAQFKFRFTDITGTATYWNNDGSGGSEPVAAVSLTVARGLFSIRLGDTNTPNMQPLAPQIFTNSEMRLRVWFDPGTGFEQLSPDHVIGSAGYAMISESVSDGAITPSKLASSTIAMFLPSSGGALSGALTNNAGFFGNGIGITNLQPGAYAETDPAFSASASAGISTVMTSQWSAAYIWGNHAVSGYMSGTNSLSELTDIGAARANLGLSTMAEQDADDVDIQGGRIRGARLSVPQNNFTVGSNQLGTAGGNVGIGTTNPACRLEVVGGTAPGEYIMKIYSGNSLVAWGKKK